MFVTVHLYSWALSGLDSHRSFIAWLSFSIGQFNKTVLWRMDTKEAGKLHADIQEELKTGCPSFLSFERTAHVCCFFQCSIILYVYSGFLILRPDLYHLFLIVI